MCVCFVCMYVCMYVCMCICMIGRSIVCKPICRGMDQKYDLAILDVRSVYDRLVDGSLCAMGTFCFCALAAFGYRRAEEKAKSKRRVM